MPYDKGDFTQQGINGDVSALVRLNDKRVVKMVLSSDDESSNVDVTGTVYDYLNGETYPLGGTTPTGTITITENTEPGSPLDIAQYRYADVSVSGGGGLTRYTDITFINNNITSVTLQFSLGDTNYGGSIPLDSDNNVLLMKDVTIAVSESATVRFANAEVPGYNITTVGYHHGTLATSPSNEFTNITNLVNMTLDIHGEPGNYEAVGIVTNKDLPASVTITLER